MVAVPAATPVTTPKVLTVATSSSELVHGDVVAAVPDPVSVVVAPKHTDVVPVISGEIQPLVKVTSLLVLSVTLEEPRVTVTCTS